MHEATVAAMFCVLQHFGVTSLEPELNFSGEHSQPVHISSPNLAISC